jgi:hypothetical protein
MKGLVCDAMGETTIDCDETLWPPLGGQVHGMRSIDAACALLPENSVKSTAKTIMAPALPPGAIETQ